MVPEEERLPIAKFTSGREREVRKERIKLANEKHVRLLRAHMKELKSHVVLTHLQNEEAFAKGCLPQYRTKDGKTLADKELGLTKLLNGPDGLVSFDEFTKLAHHSSMTELLGKTDRNVMLISSNLEPRTFKYAVTHLEELIASVPLFLGENDEVVLLPAQRLHIALQSCHMPFDITVKLRRTAERLKDMRSNGSDGDVTEVEFLQRQGTVRAFDVCSLGTGSGKTMCSIVAAMLPISTTERFRAFVESTQGTDTQRSTSDMPFTNLSRVTTTYSPSHYIRVALFQVPSALMDQWETAARTVSAGFARDPSIGVGFRVLVGHNVLRPQKTSRCEHNKGEVLVERVMKDLNAAHALSQSGGCAVLVLTDNSSAATRAYLRNNSALSVPVRVLDEAKAQGNIEPRADDYAHPPSKVGMSVMVNATLRALANTTGSQRTHPLTRAMGGVALNMNKLDHAAIMTMSKSPDWLRLLVAQGMAPLMPRGVFKKTLKLQLKSLSGRLFSTDSQLSSIESILGTLLDREISSSRSFGIDRAWKQEALDACKVVLLNASGGDVLQRMTSAIETNAAQVLALESEIIPPAIPVPRSSDDDEEEPPPPPPQLTEAQRKQQSQLKLQLVFLGCVRRMLTAVRGAIDYSDEPPEDPIDLEPISPKELALLPCCANPIRQIHVAKLTRCPYCRAGITATIDVSATKESLGRVEAVPETAVSAAAAAADAAGWLNDDDAFLAKLDRITDTTFSSGILAMTAVLKAATKWRTSLRILLCFSCSTRCNDGRAGVGATCDAIRNAVPELTSIMGLSKYKTDGALKEFQDTRGPPTARVLVIDTADSSTSVAGLDLGMAQLVVFDTVGGHRSLSRFAIVQAIGRAMRPIKGTTNVDPAAPSARAPLIMLTLSNGKVQ